MGVTLSERSLVGEEANRGQQIGRVLEQNVSREGRGVYGGCWDSVSVLLRENRRLLPVDPYYSSRFLESQCSFFDCNPI